MLRIGDIRQVLTTDHLRAFTEDPFAMTRIAAHHAMGDIWAMGARPQAALATVILPHLSEAMQQAWLAEIMAAASEVFTQAGAEIVGGHTSLGSELTIGFTVTGLCDRAPITLAGGQPGDALILTKPIGSGTILAGEMQMRARGDWVASALDLMAQSQEQGRRDFAECACDDRCHGIWACRPPDGPLRRFRLCCADRSSIAVPLMDGAEALARQGIRSTLFPANQQIATRIQIADSPRGNLLFDPQTAGGLLAAVAPEKAKASLEALTNAGYTAARIGHLVNGAPTLTAT